MHTKPNLETFQLGPFRATRLWVGLWQLSSNAWGSAPVSKVRSGMGRHTELGYNAFDMVSLKNIHYPFVPLVTILGFRVCPIQADHYGSAEIIFGQFRSSLSRPQDVIGATKWCVFKTMQPTKAAVLAVVQERMKRMNSTSVDLLQFHWQDYSDKNYLLALEHLEQLKSEGLISALGLCNFDTIRTDEICTQLGPGVIASNQVQFSIIDTRPLHGMAYVCEKHGVKLLTYGTLCGGFLADKWLNEPEPDPYSGSLTPSQRKYLDMILGAWGSWQLFQQLLITLRAIGDRHGGMSIANIATRWVLDHSFVGAVIVGTRLGLSEHPDENQNVFGFSLDDQDRADIEAVLARSNSRTMITSIGDCGAEYR